MISLERLWKGFGEGFTLEAYSSLTQDCTLLCRDIVNYSFLLFYVDLQKHAWMITVIYYSKKVASGCKNECDLTLDMFHIHSAKYKARS